MHGGGGRLCVLRFDLCSKSVKSKLKMKTLAQMRNAVLKKLNKKRKLEFSSLVMSTGSKLVKQGDPSVKKRKTESTKEKSSHKKDVQKRDLIGSSKKQNHKECQGDQSLCSSSKGKKDSGGSQTVSLKRRKVKKKKDKAVPDEAAKLQRRARYLLVKMKLEQNLIDAYSGEGWKGQSREKIKPEQELQRAKNQILKYKLGIRDTLRQLDLLGSVGQIDDSLIASDGSVHHEHIICKKCKSQEVSEDNDIILCDGTCNCAFHQKCIDPPLATKDIPPEDEGWFCKYCDCKMEILEATNAHLGTQFSADSNWQDIFKEEALIINVGTRDFNPDDEWPDDESDDNDYDPNRDEHVSGDRCSMEDSDSQEVSSTSSSCCSLESEVLSEFGISAGRHEVSSTSNFASLHQNCATESNDNDFTSGPRKRCAVDYRKLYDEMFGKDTTTGDVFSEDEDWDPSRRRRKEKENDVANTLMTLCESEVKHSDPQTLEVNNNHSKARKPISRIPSDVVQILRQAFAENELPSRDDKRKISELVGLEYKKVNKWFKNARYMALKNKKKEGASNCLPEKLDSAVDNTVEAVVSKCSPTAIPLHTKKRLKKVSWNANLITLISPSNKQKLLKTSLRFTKANVELSDDISLKKQLLYLKAKRKKRRAKCNSEQLQQQSAEKQLERLCSIERRLWNLKQVFSNIQKITENESDDLSMKEQKVVYVPVAELKEKSLTCTEVEL